LGTAKDTVTDALRSIEALLWYINYDYLNNRTEEADIIVTLAQNGGLQIKSRL
jgi:hypothetical protein